jgi:hypothetical protein
MGGERARARRRVDHAPSATRFCGRQFQDSSSLIRLAGWSHKKVSRSASEACESLSLSLAVSIRRVDGGGAMSALVRAAKVQFLTPDRVAAHGALGSIVGHAQAAVVE